MTVRLALVGLPGVGKSTVGSALAGALGAAFVDVDDVVEERTGCTPAALLRTAGETPFREAEAQALADALARPGDVVVATGGGVIESDASRGLLRDFGTVVHLVVRPEVLLARLDGGDRPLVADPSLERIDALAARRGPWYDEVADVVVDASGDVDDVVARIRGSLAR